ncbi:MAG: outer membrane beta-barrel protein [Pseudomonadota bacterium]
MKQFKLAAALVVSSALFTSPTFAYNVFKGEAMPAVTMPAYNWTGFYAGLNIGMVNHTMNITDNQATTFFATIQQVSNPYLSGGFQLGYRKQLDLNRASGVYGLEFSANFSDATYNKDYGSPFALYQLSSTNSLKDVLLLQAIGGIAADRTLLFLAAGMSWTNITGSITNTSGIPFFTTINLNQKAVGTAFGGGVEYAFTDALSFRFKVDAITPNSYTTNDGAGDSFQVTNTIWQGTFGLNYKFW